MEKQQEMTVPHVYEMCHPLHINTICSAVWLL